MHRCPAPDCSGHSDLIDVVLHVFEAIVEGQAKILRELRNHRTVPPHVQAGMNALDEQIRQADEALSHQ